jgi:uncharacterized membrane protein
VLTVTIVLALAALIAAVIAAMQRCPLWVSVVILCLIELIRALPMGR